MSVPVNFAKKGKIDAFFTTSDLDLHFFIY